MNRLCRIVLQLVVSVTILYVVAKLAFWFVIVFFWPDIEALILSLVIAGLIIAISIHACRLGVTGVQTRNELIVHGLCRARMGRLVAFAGELWWLCAISAIDFGIALVRLLLRIDPPLWHDIVLGFAFCLGFMTTYKMNHRLLVAIHVHDARGRRDEDGVELPRVAAAVVARLPVATATEVRVAAPPAETTSV